MGLEENELMPLSMYIGLSTTTISGKELIASISEGRRSMNEFAGVISRITLFRRQIIR
jgi:hypothetical protein